MAFSVLLVDDDPFPRQLLPELIHDATRAWCRDAPENFDNAPHIVSCAASGEEALEYLEKTSVDVVLSDVAMEPMTGKELLVHVYSAHYRGDVRPQFLMMTALETPEHVTELLLAGASGVISKNESPEIFLQSLLQVYHGNTVVNPSDLSRFLSDVREKTSTQQEAVTLFRSFYEHCDYRDRMIMRHLLERKTNREIARAVGYSERTVKRELTRLFSACRVKRRGEMIRIMHESGLFS